ncbi:Putative cell wall binding repeat 2 [Herbiconiux ginsengi]|uniref:Putative cell wall binding repeat 2 n=1 Tax=Herbiconiux ginsengi TaxID=381665 RepID=A0A1H3ME87_9MICO|nr:cell wall-binding repeat-containing protein [Herbiconiux ginsengi]SDY74648.1 Putative cell wall binding repeat 2 [Herbiconiux ginsengi]
MGVQTTASARHRTSRVRRGIRSGGIAAFIVAIVATSLGSGGIAQASGVGGDASDDPPSSGSELSVSVSRISAADRYDLAAEIGKRVSPGASNVVYLASGASFPDALSAGPAASVNFAPLLLVPPDSVPASVAASLTRLDPLVVKVIGGPASVSDAVVATVRTLAPHALVSRISGSDRYAVSRAVVADAYPDGVTGVMVATGRDFPDALSAGAVAGAVRVPVLLVDGGAAFADGPTVTLLRDLNAFIVTIVGGPTSVSDGIQSTINPGGGVLRVTGANRYEVSLNLAGFDAPTTRRSTWPRARTTPTRSPVVFSRPRRTPQCSSCRRIASPRACSRCSPAKARRT